MLSCCWCAAGPHERRRLADVVAEQLFIPLPPAQQPIGWDDEAPPLGTWSATRDKSFGNGFWSDDEPGPRKTYRSIACFPWSTRLPACAAEGLGGDVASAAAVMQVARTPSSACSMPDARAENMATSIVLQMCCKSPLLSSS